MAELEDERPAGDEGGPAAEAAIRVRSDPSGVPVIAVSGELDLSNADRLEAAVDSAAAGHPERLVFEMKDLRFMDSAGIAVLLGAASKVSAVSLRDPSEAVRRVVELTGLDEVLTIEP
jgi:anti-sigma B factor antagonist